MRWLFFLGLFVFSVACSAESEESVFSKLPESRWVLESENAYVLEDKYPQAPVHLLVISKKIIPNINDVPEPLLGEMLELAKLAAKKYDIAESGYRVVINTNAEGGQGVYHVHIHVLGGRQMEWPPG